MYIELGKTFAYTYSTAAHYTTVIGVTSGLKQISEEEIPNNKPGGSVKHILVFKAISCGIETIERTTITRDGRLHATKTFTITVISPKCVTCQAPTTHLCTNCLEAYCSIECQEKDWKLGHRIKCGGVLIFDASGFLIGTSHHVKIENGLYVSTGKRSADMKRMLSQEQQNRLCRILEKYEPLFHSPTNSDLPRGGDMGTTRFIFNGKYASPKEVPELCKFLLEIDPLLSNSPGGIS